MFGYAVEISGWHSLLSPFLCYANVKVNLSYFCNEGIKQCYFFF